MNCVALSQKKKTLQNQNNKSSMVQKSMFRAIEWNRTEEWKQRINSWSYSHQLLLRKLYIHMQKG